MVRNSKRRNPNGASGNKPSPRRGAKTKQTKVTKAKETEPKVVRQLKLTFADETPTPNSGVSARTAAITPEVPLVARLPTHPSPLSTPDRNTTKETESDDDRKPAAKPKEKNTLKPPPPPLPHSTHIAEPAMAKKQSPVPQALQTPSQSYQEIRYNGQIETPPSETPFEDFVTLLKAYFKIIQDVLGKEVYLAAWDKEQEKSFPPLKRTSKIPSSRESLGIYLGNYINPKQDGSRVYLNLRLVTYIQHQVPLDRFGSELADSFSNSKNKWNIQRQPKACQAAKSACVGWMMYSCKSISSTTFVPALKKSLNIPDSVSVGIQFRTIATETGKKPPFDRDNPPAAAIHIDIDERYALVYQGRAASLWRKNSKQRLPNGVQLRLIPCFSSATGRSMTEAQRSDAKTLTERQYYFLKQHLRMLPPYFFISQLDTPLSSSNSMTLRRAMMARSPAKSPTTRLIHNIDASWNQPSKYTITSVMGKDDEAQRFLTNLIPEFLHRFGDEATKWFTGEGLLVYEGVKWNPKKGTTSSAKEQDSEEMVQEDLWDLTNEWEKIRENSPTETSKRPDATTLDQTTKTNATNQTPKTTTNPPAPEQSRLASDKSIASFGNVYQRPHDEEDNLAAEAQAKEDAANYVAPSGTQFDFNAEQIEQDRKKAQQGPPSTDFSMSTAAKTTPRTRLKLKEAQEEIEDLRRALANQLLKKDPSLQPSLQSLPPSDGTFDDQANGTLADDDNRTLAPGSGNSLPDHDEDKMQIDSPPASPQKPPASPLKKTATELEQYNISQALHKAVYAKKETIDADSDAMEENDHDPIIIGSSSENPSSTSASKSATSSSSSSTSSSSSDDTASTQDTQDLVNQIKEKTPTKTLATLDENSDFPPLAPQGNSKDSADRQHTGTDSDLRRAHLPLSASSGKAGVPPRDAGLGD
jgi:hypothetical protein